jgi:hypothetical protein
MTIQEVIEQIEKDVLDPGTSSENLIKLSVLYARLATETAKAEAEYNKQLRAYLEENKELPAKKAEIHAKGSPHYATLIDLRAQEKGTVEVIRSLKKYIRIKEEEMRQSYNIG